MKRHLNTLRRIVMVIALLATAKVASAQYYNIINQATGMLGNALQGGFNYKGYVETKYIKGIGENNGDFVGLSTSQGFMYGQRFFMGLGAGVDLLMAHVDNDAWQGPQGDDIDKGVTKNGCVVPLFTDFRLIVGPLNDINCQLGLKVGCSFLLSDDYIRVNRGYITSNECFFLMPSIGVRIPVSDSNPKQAFTLNVAYQLITPTYRTWWNGYYNDESITLNGFGLTCSFEW